MGTLWLDCPTLTSVVALTTLKNCWPARTDHPVTEQDRFLKAASDVRAGGVEPRQQRIRRRPFLVISTGCRYSPVRQRTSVCIWSGSNSAFPADSRSLSMN